MQDKRYIRPVIGLLAFLACVWLIPAATSLAASASSGFTVSVQVVDAVAIDSGNGWARLSPLQAGSDTRTEFVTQVASPKPYWNEVVGSTEVHIGFPLGNSGASGFAGDAAGGGIMLLKTAIRL